MKKYSVVVLSMKKKSNDLLSRVFDKIILKLQ